VEAVGEHPDRFIPVVRVEDVAQTFDVRLHVIDQRVGMRCGPRTLHDARCCPVGADEPDRCTQILASALFGGEHVRRIDYGRLVVGVLLDVVEQFEGSAD
jgi:hypothetical protein